MEVLPAFSPEQIGDVVLKPTDTANTVYIINIVFNHLGNGTKFREFLVYLQINIAGVNNPNVLSFNAIQAFASLT